MIYLAILSAVILGTFSVTAHADANTYSPAQAVQSALLVQINADSEEGARSFINNMAQKAIGFLGDETQPMDQKVKEFRRLLKSSYDMPTIGRFALGRYWKVATPAQQQEYQKLFEAMVVEVYSRRFSDYKGQAFEVPSAKSEGNNDVIVTSFIVPENGEKIQVDWRVRFKNGQHKIVDVIVEGVSMALTQRSDFASVIQRGGGKVDVLLAHLRGQ